MKIRINTGYGEHTLFDCAAAYMGKIKEVIFNEPATIVFWNDGTKTVVKTSPNDKFDKEKGILWAYFLKHASGTKTKLQKEIASYCKKA